MEHKYVTVSALNRYLKAVIDNDEALNRIYIRGEISNVKYHYNGHCYFTLKDEKSKVNAVMFSTYLKKIGFKLEDGMQVQIIGSISLYEAGGQYQLYAYSVQMDGLGRLFEQYEKLKLKLEKEGLFNAEHKKEIPKFPTTVGIITAKTGAAIHDMIRTIQNNAPSTKIFFFPSLVQGENAAKNLINQIKYADSLNLDVLIIGRGGGSLEDLWAFNDERLAYEIYNCHTPIISGVGHESDFTICDFVADRRCATPTAAASMAVFNQVEFLAKVSDYQQKLSQLMNHRLNINKEKLLYLCHSHYLKNPIKLYENRLLHLSMLTDRMGHALQKEIHIENRKISDLDYRLQLKCELFFTSQNQLLKQIDYSLNYAMNQLVKSKKQTLLSLIGKLDSLSPLNVLSRGYAVVYQNNQIKKSVQEIDYKLPLTVQLQDGNIDVFIKEGKYGK